MKTRKLSLIVLGILLMGNVSLQAEEIPDKEVVDNVSQAEAPAIEQPVSQADLEGVRGELAVLSDKLARQLDKNVAATTRSLKISGSTSSKYSAVQYTNKPGEYKSGFAPSSVSVSFKGNLKKDYDYGRDLNYVAGFSASATSTATSNTVPQDAYIQYSLLPTRDQELPTLTLQFGQQKRLFGLEAASTEEKQPVINGATFAGGSGLNLSPRDIGLQLKGDLFPTVDLGFGYRVPLIEYYLGVYNGAGANLPDTDTSRDILGRIVFNAPVGFYSPYKGLSFGSSFYKPGDVDITNAAGLKGRGSKFRYGQDISYVSAPIGFTAEYAVGRDENFSNSTASAVKTTTQSQGYTLTLFYSFGEQFLPNFKSQSRSDDWWPKTYEPFVRFDRWDPNTSVDNDHTTIVTYGLNVFFAETTKLAINYSLTDKLSTNLKQNDLVVQFQYSF